MTYIKFSDRSVETCEAYRRGRAINQMVLCRVRTNLLTTNVVDSTGKIIALEILTKVSKNSPSSTGGG